MAIVCDTCDTAVVRNDRKPPHDIDITATIDALSDRVRRGRMRFVSGDVPLEDMLDLAYSELRYTIVSFLRCEDCGRMRFWGLCIRGAPVYKVVEDSAPHQWTWESVPPREAWSRRGGRAGGDRLKTMAGARAARATRAWRGVAAAAFATFVAALSHSAAQGEAAPLLGMVLAFALSAPVCVALAGRGLSWVRLALAVGLSQAAFHTLLAVGVGEAARAALSPVSAHAWHAATLSPSAPVDLVSAHALAAHTDAPMWTAHLLAAAVTVLAFGRGERAVRAVVRFAILHLVVRPIVLPAPRRAARIPGFGRLLSDPGFVLLSTVRRRGPPLAA